MGQLMIPSDDNTYVSVNVLFLKKSTFLSLQNYIYIYLILRGCGLSVLRFRYIFSFVVFPT
jgi:hypothetical protein